MRTGAAVTMPRHLRRTVWGEVIRALTLGALIGLWVTAAMLVFR